MFIHKITKTVAGLSIVVAPFCVPSVVHADVVNPSGCVKDVGQAIAGASLAAGGAMPTAATVAAVGIASVGVASAFQDCAPAPAPAADDDN